MLSKGKQRISLDFLQNLKSGMSDIFKVVPLNSHEVELMTRDGFEQRGH